MRKTIIAMIVFALLINAVNAVNADIIKDIDIEGIIDEMDDTLQDTKYKLDDISDKLTDINTRPNEFQNKYETKIEAANAKYHILRGDYQRLRYQVDLWNNFPERINATDVVNAKEEVNVLWRETTNNLKPLVDWVYPQPPIPPSPTPTPPLPEGEEEEKETTKLLAIIGTITAIGIGAVIYSKYNNNRKKGNGKTKEEPKSIIKG